jgi:hypothetical protein
LERREGGQVMDDYRYMEPTPKIVSVGVCIVILMSFLVLCWIAEFTDPSNWSMKAGVIGANVIMFIIGMSLVKLLFASVKYLRSSLLAQANKKK